MKKIIVTILAIAVLAGLVLLAGAYYKKSQIDDYKAAHYGESPMEADPELEELREKWADALGPGPISELGKPHIMAVGQETTFSDGLTIRLKYIGDSRCKRGHQCFWEGELNPTFEVSLDDQKTWQEISLGTVRTRSAAVGIYTITLSEAKTSSATVIVEKRQE